MPSSGEWVSTDRKVRARFCGFLADLSQRHRGETAQPHLAQFVAAAVAVEEDPPFRCVPVDDEIQPVTVRVSALRSDRLHRSCIEPVDLSRYLASQLSPQRDWGDLDG